MKLVLATLSLVAITSFAATENPDGSILLSRDEVEEFRVHWYQMQYNFGVAVEMVGDLRRQLGEKEAELEMVKKRKCL